MPLDLDLGLDLGLDLLVGHATRLLVCRIRNVAQRAAPVVLALKEAPNRGLNGNSCVIGYTTQPHNRISTSVVEVFEVNRNEMRSFLLTEASTDVRQSQHVSYATVEEEDRPHAWAACRQTSVRMLVLGWIS